MARISNGEEEVFLVFKPVFSDPTAHTDHLLQHVCWLRTKCPVFALLPFSTLIASVLPDPWILGF